MQNLTENTYRVGQKSHHFCTPYNFKIFYCQNQETICNRTIIIYPTTPQVCRYTTFLNIRPRTQAGDAAAFG